MTRRIESTQSVAVYLGVTTATVNNWIKSDPQGFPAPDFEVMAGPRVIARAWFEDKLPLLRAWFNSYKGFSEERAREHWAEVDEFIRTGVSPSSRRSRIHPDQLAIDVAA